MTMLEEDQDKLLSKLNPTAYNIIDVSKDKKILKQKELTYLMHRLKSYYNYLQKSVLDNNSIINQQKMQERKYDNLIKDGISQVKECNIFEDITLFTTTSSDNLQLRVENLKNAKNDLLMKLQQELDYDQSLRTKLKSERENILYYNDLEIEVRDKIQSIAKSLSSLDINQNEFSKKTRNLTKIRGELSDKMDTMNRLIYTQSLKSTQISKKLEVRKNGLIKEKEKLTKNNIKNEKNTIDKKNHYKELMRSVDKIKASKIEKETRVIKTILGLDLIKRYIVNKDNESLNDPAKLLIESDEYKLFKNLKIAIIPPPENFKTLYRRASTLNFSNSNNFNPNKTEERRSINLSDIKTKFENMDLNFEELFDFQTKIVNKRQFNRNILMKFNLKQINLESKKQKHSKKVSSLIMKDYKNMEEVMKSNSRVEALMKKFCYYKYDSKIDQQTILFADLLNNINNNFYHKCFTVVEEIKSFFEIFSTIVENYDVENQNDFNLISVKIKEYFKFLEDIPLKSKEDYLDYVFKSFESLISADSIEYIKLTDEELLFNQEINESNILDMYKYYYNNKRLFISVKLNYEDCVLYCLGNLCNIEEIITLIKQLIINSNFIHSDKPSKDDLNTILTRPQKVKKSTMPRIKSMDCILRNKEKEEIETEESNSFKEEIMPNVVVKKQLIETKKPKISTALEKLIEPYLEKKKYLRNLNENVMNIKKDTKNYKRENFILTKKQDELAKISNEMILYNNPKINLNSLNCNTYNTFVKQIILTQYELNNPKREYKRNFSNPNFKKK